MAKGNDAPGRWLSPRLATAVGAAGAGAAVLVAAGLLTGAIPQAGASVQSAGVQSAPVQSRPARPDQCDLSINIKVDARGNESYGVRGGCQGRMPSKNLLTHMLGVAHLVVPVYTVHGNTCIDLDSRTCFMWAGQRITVLWDREGDTVTS